MKPHEPTPRSAPLSDALSSIPCSDPASGLPLGEVPIMDATEVARVVESARVASKAWAATSFAQRREVLRDLLERIVEHQADICRTCARDSGKTMVDAAMGEIFPVCEKLRYTIEHGEHDLAPEARSSGFLVHKQAWVEYQPLGVIGVICPWNFPFHNLYCPMIPALFAGNAVVAKVSEWTAWSAPALLEHVQAVLRDHGHSPDLVQIVQGFGQTGEHLVRSGVDKIFFTGSPDTGRKVMRAASDNLTPVVLELGGKDPMLVCDDANLQQAADAAMLGVFTACGQMCVGVERVYVYDAVYDDFVAAVAPRIAALRQGPPLACERVDVGATTMPDQLAKIEALVDDAVGLGAKVVSGGARAKIGDGNYFQPTLLTEVDHSMRIAREECFGPVMTIIRVHDDEEALKMANDCPYGLGASVFSQDDARAVALARGIRSGMAVVNDYGLAYMIQSLPFGGVGDSGMGRINGREGLRACCHQKAMVSDRVSVGKSVAIHPIRSQSFALVESAVRTLYGRGRRKRGRAALDALRNAWSMWRASD